MTARPDWWATFFSGPALEAWRRLVSPEQTAADVACIERWLAPAAGASLLDVPCGNGRHAVALARRGFEITAVDLAETFVEEGRRAAAVAGLQVGFRVAEMRELEGIGPCDGAFTFGNSFGYLDDAGNEAFLRAVAAALRPGAGFLVQTGVAAESILPALSEPRWYRAGELLLLTESEYDPLRSRLETVYTFVHDGRIDSRRASYRIYTLRQLCELLRESGFDAIEAFGDPEGSSYIVGCPELYLLARRAGG